MKRKNYQVENEKKCDKKRANNLAVSPLRFEIFRSNRIPKLARLFHIKNLPAIGKNRTNDRDFPISNNRFPHIFRR